MRFQNISLLFIQNLAVTAILIDFWGNYFSVGIDKQ